MIYDALTSLRDEFVKIILEKDETKRVKHFVFRKFINMHTDSKSVYQAIESRSH